MRIFAITFGDAQTASTRYRILQYEELFKSPGSFAWTPKQKLRLADLSQMRIADCVINQKCLLPLPWGWAIRAATKRLIFDCDDAVWTRPGKPYSAWSQWKVNSRLHWWLKHSDTVTCANFFLADYVRKYNQNVVIIPMALNLEKWHPQIVDKKEKKDVFIIGWTGSPANLPYLKLCEAPLGAFLKKHPHVILKIMCGEYPELSIPFEYTTWSPKVEVSFLQSLDAGLLPLPQEDTFGFGKSPIKAFQYMACGIPVVGNMTRGGASEIAKNGGCLVVHTPDEWTPALESLLDAESYRQLSLAALKNARENHDIKKVFECWRKLLRG